MSRESLEKALPVGERLLLDTTTLIAYLSFGEQVSPVSAYIIDEMVRSGRNPAVVSAVTAMELLVRPLHIGAVDVSRRIMDFLTSFPNLQSLNVDLQIAQEAAFLRATLNLRSPDALIIAAGLTRSATHLVTNAAEWQRKLVTHSERVNVCYLESHLPFL